jgi:hypothetical protein
MNMAFNYEVYYGASYKGFWLGVTNHTAWTITN